MKSFVKIKQKIYNHQIFIGTKFGNNDIRIDNICIVLENEWG